MASIVVDLIGGGIEWAIGKTLDGGKQASSRMLRSSSTNIKIDDSDIANADASLKEGNRRGSLETIESSDKVQKKGSNEELDAYQEEGKVPYKRIERLKWLAGFASSLIFLIAASIGSFYLTSSTGMFALGSMCEEMQQSVLEQVHERLLGNMEPLRIYLQTGITMFDESGLDLSTWPGLQETLSYQHNFLDTYLDESRCCSGVFTNIAYDHVADGVDDVAVCHALEAPDCSSSHTGSMEKEIAMANLTGDAIWAGVLHYSESYTEEFRAEHGTAGGNEHAGDFVQVLPGNTNGAPNNTLTFKYYEKQHAMGPWFGDKNIKKTSIFDENCTGRCYEDKTDGHWAVPIGFVHWPIQDGYWYREIQVNDMRKGDVRAAPKVFPWTLYPPAVLKTHLFTPVYNPKGDRIGGWVVGFKLHWLSQFLAGLRMDGECMSVGCFCFIVERETGSLVATSDPSIKLLTNDDTTNGEPINVITALESDDERVSTISKKIVGDNGGNWTNVHKFKSREDIEVDTSLVEEAINLMTVAKPFIMTADFKRRSDEPMNSTKTDVPHGIDWIVVLSIPDAVVMSAINNKRKQNTVILLGFSIGLDLFDAIWVWGMALLGFYIGMKLAEHFSAFKIFYSDDVNEEANEKEIKETHCLDDTNKNATSISAQEEGFDHGDDFSREGMSDKDSETKWIVFQMLN